jgi:hypothetical protein
MVLEAALIDSSENHQTRSSLNLSCPASRLKYQVSVGT